MKTCSAAASGTAPPALAADCSSASKEALFKVYSLPPFACTTATLIAFDCARRVKGKSRERSGVAG